MIVAQYRDSEYFAGQKLIAGTVLFDKNYYWMRDVDDVVYLARIDDAGNPRFI